MEKKDFEKEKKPDEGDKWIPVAFIIMVIFLMAEIIYNNVVSVTILAFIFGFLYWLSRQEQDKKQSR